MRMEAKNRQFTDKIGIEDLISYLFGLHENQRISEEDLEILIEYIDEKIMQGYPIDVITSRLQNPVQRAF